jgi:hypothetical protein
MKKNGLIKRKDFILFFVLLCLSILILLISFFGKTEGNYVIIQQNGVKIEELSLDKNGTYVIEDGTYYNKLVIRDGAVYVEDANCRDLICVRHGSISKVNETITCLPHKLIVYVVGDNISEVDAVVK